MESWITPDSPFPMDFCLIYIKERAFFQGFFTGLLRNGQLAVCSGERVKGGSNLEEKGSTLRRRIKEGRLRREDVLRRLAELAFGQPNDCVRLALEGLTDLKGLDLSLLSEIKRSEKGMVEIKLIDRLKALEQLAQAAGQSQEGMEQFLLALQQSAGDGP